MLSLIPPFMAITIILSATLMMVFSAEETSISKELARDMLRHHEHHHAIAMEAEFALQQITDDLPYPFENIVSWRSDVLTTPSGPIVVTWPTGFGTDGINLDVYRAVLRDFPRRTSAIHPGYLMIDENTGNRFIGDLALPQSAPLIPAGAPVLVQ